MSDVNNVVIGGRLVEDPNLKDVGESKVCKLRIASSKIFGKAKTEKTVFVDIDAWNGLGETCAKFLKKGAKIYVTGTLRQDNWEQDGVKRQKIYIDASEIEFGPKDGGSGDSGDAKRQEKAPASNKKPPTTPQEEIIDDDDLPF